MMDSKKSLHLPRNSIKEALKWALSELKDISDSPALDAEILLSEAIDKKREFLHRHPEYEMGNQELKSFQECIARRTTHEPLAYILGWKEFYGNRFLVDRRVLIPRPETERLVELAVEAAKRLSREQARVMIADICTGSGCVGISIGLELLRLGISNFKLYMSDIDDGALEVARTNAEKLFGEVKVEYEILRSDLLEYFLDEQIGIDILTANPPYIPAQDIEELPKTIKGFEPRVALEGGNEGNEVIEQIISQTIKLRIDQQNCFIEGKDGEIVYPES